MKTYKASEELVVVLLKNAFVETTQKDYPHHFERMVEKGYNPWNIKRSFTHKNNHTKGDFIIFDYININLFYHAFEVNHSTSLTEEEVNKIITFYSSNTREKSKMMDKKWGIL